MLEVRFVNWDVVGRNFGNPTRGALNFASALGVATLPSGTPPFGTILGRVLSSGVEADVMIRALEERGVVRRLAEPNLIAMSGEKASFLAGGEFPIPVAGTFQQITVEYKKFGVGLTFVPTVLANGVINLKIEPEVSHIDTTNSIRTGVVAIPAITVRRRAELLAEHVHGAIGERHDVGDLGVADDEVDEAQRGLQGLRLALRDAHRPDLVLADLHEPGLGRRRRERRREEHGGAEDECGNRKRQRAVVEAPRRARAEPPRPLLPRHRRPRPLSPRHLAVRRRCFTQFLCATGEARDVNQR